MEKPKVEKAEEIKQVKENTATKTTKAKPAEAKQLTQEEQIEAAKKLLEAKGYDVTTRKTPTTGASKRGEY